MPQENFIAVFHSDEKEYNILSYLGDGATCICFKVYEKISDKIYALKIFKSSADTYFFNEVEKIRLIQNQCDSIIRLFDYGEGQICNFNENKIDINLINKFQLYNNKTVKFSVFEYLENGELFDYIYYLKEGFNEDITRMIFKKILNAIEVCHKNHFCHGDLKPENILIANDFSVRLIDFGFSKDIRYENELFYSWRGTDIYSCPETLKCTTKGYNGYKNDIFSLGVLLFILVVGRFPFNVCNGSDKRYKLIICKKFEEFWDIFQEKIKYELSNEFKDLVQNLICYNPNERLSLEQIKNHPWLKIHKQNEQELYQNEFIMRKDVIDISKKSMNY